MPDIAAIRLANALLLRDHFARQWSASEDAKAKAKAKSPEAAFADLIGISAAYWSQLKARHRHIPEKFARIIEEKCEIDEGSLDVEGGAKLPASVLPNTLTVEDSDEKHAVRLFLIAYRMNPQATKERMLEVLDEEALKGGVNGVSVAKRRQRRA